MKRIANVILSLLAVVASFATITPQLSKDLGKVMDGIYSYIPQWGFAIITVVILIILWIINSPKSENGYPLLFNNTQGNKNIDFTGAKIKDSTIIIDTENKKKDDPKPKGINFPPRWRNRILSVKNTSLEHVDKCLKLKINNGLWYHLGEDEWYEVTPKEDDFYNPNTHDIDFYGYSISGRKKKIIRGKDGSIKNIADSKEDIERIFAMFARDILARNSITVQVRLDSDYLYGELFFDDIQFALENEFGEENVEVIPSNKPKKFRLVFNQK